uniref:Retrotransposon gag domain-containing protein n=1 Tax=Nymphaea colorata TaxID=210225 RepID=A0A5K1CFD4_9MAGN
MCTFQGQEDLTEMVNKLATDVATHKEALGNAAESFGEMKDEMKVLREQVADLAAMNRALTDIVTALQAEVKELQVKNHTLQRQISVGGGDDRLARVDVQRPAKYNGTRDSRVIDNFLFQVQYYLDLQGIMGDDLQVKTTTILLEGNAVAWWRRKKLDIQKGICTIDTFDDF